MFKKVSGNFDDYTIYQGSEKHEHDYSGLAFAHWDPNYEGAAVPVFYFLEAAFKKIKY